MESFLNVVGNHAVTNISLAQGQTAVVRLKKFDVGQPVANNPGLFLRPQVVVACRDPSVAFCFQVSKLAQPKKAYDNKYNVNQIDTTIMESNGFYYFQICGKTVGATELSAVYANQQQTGAYASSISIVVTEKRKRLFLTPDVAFSRLWDRHPLFDPAYMAPAYTPPAYKGPVKTIPVPRWDESRNHPCPLKGFEQCMVRLCTALTSAGAGLAGLSGWRCPMRDDPKHKFHFVQPYDFPIWKATSFYLWETNKYQPEPMPGLAAWPFMLRRHGIVLFRNYFTNDGALTGGHIDLWNVDRMGNNSSAANPSGGEGLAAFFRSEKIYFWPMD
jgi:hypothetical protein